MHAPIGAIVNVRGIECRIFRIRPAGTLDVEATDGSGRCWRLSGLAFSHSHLGPMMTTPPRLINTYDQLRAAGGGTAISYHGYGNPGSPSRGWHVWRVANNGSLLQTDPKAAWYDHGHKVFRIADSTRKEAFEEAKRWVAKTFGEHGPWVRNAMRDYVPERIAKAYPLPRRGTLT
jgi:hypothetical protein